MNFIFQNPPAFNFINTLVSKLRIADEPFVFQNERKDRKPAGQMFTNNAENKKHTGELLGADNESDKREEFLKEYVHGLEEMMFMTHHKVRQPVANILGMANLIDQYANSPDELKKIVSYMQQSASDLDAFTRELTNFISNLEQKGKGK